MKYTPVFILIVLSIVLCMGGYFLIKGGDHADDLIQFRDVSLADTSDTAVATNDSEATTTPKALAESTPTTNVVTQDLRSYQNAAFHFGLLFPKNLSAREYKEQGGALTVTFTDSATGESFQIYATPYADTKITADRFKLDEPSGAYMQPTDILIDKVRATMFFSKNAIMGDVREVWFIRNGYLYEVTTYKELDSWLGEIMKTWKFL